MKDQTPTEKLCVDSLIILSCINCKNRISKVSVTSTSLDNFIFKDHYSIKPIYLTLVLPRNKFKQDKNGLPFLRDEVKCLKCEKTIAICIKSASKDLWKFLDCIIFNTSKIQIIYTENSEKEIKSKRLYNSEIIDKITNKDFIFNVISKNFCEIESLILNFEKFFDKLCNDYNEVLEKMEEFKNILSKDYMRVKFILNAETENNTKLFGSIKLNISNYNNISNINNINNSININSSNFIGDVNLKRKATREDHVLKEISKKKISK